MRHKSLVVYGRCAPFFYTVRIVDRFPLTGWKAGGASYDGVWAHQTVFSCLSYAIAPSISTALFLWLNSILYQFGALSKHPSDNGALRLSAGNHQVHIEPVSVGVCEPWCYQDRRVWYVNCVWGWAPATAKLNVRLTRVARSIKWQCVYCLYDNQKPRYESAKSDIHLNVALGPSPSSCSCVPTQLTTMDPSEVTMLCTCWSPNLKLADVHMHVINRQGDIHTGDNELSEETLYNVIGNLLALRHQRSTASEW